jgi:hypothetical protein
MQSIFHCRTHIAALDAKFARGAAVAMLLTGSGCSTEFGYNIAQSWQRNACNKIQDQAERNRCLDKAGMTYDDYRRQTGQK